ncbi:tRNA A37 threonylcarbamoyladenosine synthetase subunit TsaC/SUA5/YrdC [ [Peptoniphilus sp. ING2-D1G]|nr:tRNA A37 threonylcarbamoyladenosine synthetase subunit TsaC/SUA5/YrdC [ [Peptoniphilus sp. ING2-D1G]
MKTKIIRVKNGKIENSDLKVIDEAFKTGKLVAFPTETVYGLGANGLDEQASMNIFKAKGRPADNPLILHIANVSQIRELVEDIPDIAIDLIDMFWPGPLTLIFNRSKAVPDVITAGLGTVAIRMPSHPVARKILAYTKLPIAAPSANLSGKPSPTSLERVMEDLNGKVDIIVDGGRTNYGIESTVVDLTENPPIILRPGGITTEDLKVIVPDIRMDRATIDASEDKVPKSPGQKYKHYAPIAQCYTFAGALDIIVKNINKKIKENEDKKIAVLATEETKDDYEGAYIVINLGSRDNLIEVAHNLFEALRQCDDEEVDMIYAEGFEFRGLGVGIMNRLLKASSGRVIFGL